MMHQKIGQFVFWTWALIAVTNVQADHPPSSYVAPEGLVRGAAFIDRFLPVPLQATLRSDVWGANHVIPRDANNGIEDAQYSYWGGNMITGDDGKEHLFVCRWPENNVKGKKTGHHTWWSSVVVHAVSDSPFGPFKVVGEVGKGHNPEIYRLKDGSYKIGVMNKSYHGPTLDGPWELIDTTLHIKEPGSYINKSNKTFVTRDDGSVLMMNKNGIVFISENADENFVQATDSVFPKLGEGLLEDPVIWKDEVQYHLILNDAWGRAAFYMRSPDGLKWKWVPGKAYTPEVMIHEGGTTEKWFKFERPKVRQDRYGRATHMNFAVIDVNKSDDLASDNHSSKNVVIPLTVPRRIQILNKEPIAPDTKRIRVKILAEDGFEPTKEVDAESLTFGAPEAVNFGKGCKPVFTQASGSDLIVTFTAAGNGITESNFTAKLIGRTKTDELLFGYSALPSKVNSLRANEANGANEENGANGADGADAERRVIKLWPASEVGDPEAMGTLAPDRGDGVVRVTKVTVPSMEYYPASPQHSSNGSPNDRSKPAVILCPGGGYSILAVSKMDVIADLLNSVGIDAFVLKYRVPQQRELAYKDVQRAIRIVRSRAVEWGIDPDRIGILGSSAGGNLAARASCGVPKEAYKAVDKTDRVSALPNYTVLLYPAYMIKGRKSKGNQLHAAFAPSKNLGPTLIITALDDKTYAQSSFVYAQALKNTGASVRVHLFEKGGHGFGLRPDYKPLRVWPDLCLQWLRDISVLRDTPTDINETPSKPGR